MAMNQRNIPDPELSKALTYHKAGEFQRALKGYKRVLKKNPRHRDALVLGSQAAFHAGLQREAIRWMEKACQLNPNDADALYNLGVMFKAKSELSKAQSAFAKAIQANPNFALAHYNFGMTLFEENKYAEAVESFDKAIAADPAMADAHASKGFVLRELEEVDEAITAYREAIRLQPQNAKTWSGLAVCLQENDQLEEAVEANRNAIAVNPDYPEATANLCDTLIQMRKPEDAVQVCNEYLQRHPTDACVLAAKTIALNEVDDQQALAEILDLDTIVRPITHEAPKGFSDIETFNKKLSQHILKHPSLRVSPSSHATRKGKHSGTLNTGEMGPIAAFETLIHQAVDDYVLNFEGPDHHPIIAQRPQNYKLSVWAVVLEGEGYQVPHIHPSAWLSGVYYASVPAVSSAGGNEGWIEFGQPGPEYHFESQPKLRLVKPEPGLMVMFPSYVFHRTVPFESQDTRISVAFDVVPS